MLMFPYLQTSDGRVGGVGELRAGRLVGTALPARCPARQQALVVGGDVCYGVGGGAGQAEQDRVIGQTDVAQAESHPLSVEEAGRGRLAVVRETAQGSEGTVEGPQCHDDENITVKQIRNPECLINEYIH